MCGDWTKQILHYTCHVKTVYIIRNTFKISRPYKLHYTIYTEIILFILQHTDRINSLFFFTIIIDRSFKRHMIECTICTVPTGIFKQ